MKVVPDILKTTPIDVFTPVVWSYAQILFFCPEL